VLIITRSIPLKKITSTKPYNLKNYNFPALMVTIALIITG
jgi:hypothetical protein